MDATLRASRPNCAEGDSFDIAIQFTTEGWKAVFSFDNEPSRAKWHAVLMAATSSQTQRPSLSPPPVRVSSETSGGGGSGGGDGGSSLDIESATGAVVHGPGRVDYQIITDVEAEVVL